MEGGLLYLKSEDNVSFRKKAFDCGADMLVAENKHDGAALTLICRLRQRLSAPLQYKAEILRATSLYDVHLRTSLEPVIGYITASCFFFLGSKYIRCV